MRSVLATQAIRGLAMRNLVLSTTTALILFTGLAAAADVRMAGKAPPAPAPAAPAFPCDVAFGGAVMNNYIFRGVSQSNNGPSATAYIEPQCTTPVGTFYVGTAGWAINWPSSPLFGFTDPTAEIDFYGGWRNTWGAFSIDIGFIYYWYPREIFNGFTDDSDFWEVYAKVNYAITPDLSISALGFYTPDILNYSQTFAALGINADAEGFYAALAGKWVLPWKHGDLGAYVSSELGHWWIDKSGFVLAGLTDPSYTYWNVGLAFTYKALTLDFRYHGTDQNAVECGSFLLVVSPHPSNSWCDDTYTVTVKFDTTLSALK
jgi:uncharacterized protein (TIGR02001 family)